MAPNAQLVAPSLLAVLKTADSWRREAFIATTAVASPAGARVVVELCTGGNATACPIVRRVLLGDWDNIALSGLEVVPRSGIAVVANAR